MVFKCSLTVVIEGDGDSDVVSEERVAVNPLIGLDLLWTRVKEQLSMLALPIAAGTSSMQLLGWVDPILHPSEAEMASTKQRLIDKSKVVASVPDASF